MMASDARKVLLIEQNPELRSMITRNLSTAARRFEPLPEFSDPVAFAVAIQPQVIVIRLKPLIPHGLLVLQGLLKNPRTATIPLVVICTLQREATVVATLPNVSEILVAPFRLESLRDAIDRASRAGER